MTSAFRFLVASHDSPPYSRSIRGGCCLSETVSELGIRGEAWRFASNSLAIGFQFEGGQRPAPRTRAPTPGGERDRDRERRHLSCTAPSAVARAAAISVNPRGDSGERERDTIAPADVPNDHEPNPSPEPSRPRDAPAVSDPRRKHGQHDERYES